jgi:ribosomal protein L7Ae-like RNA K-turn-binding protein
MVERIYSFLGLATKAGKIISGEGSCEKAIKNARVYLVIVTQDSSDNTKKKFKNMCSYRNIEIRFFGEKDKLGRYIGKKVRSVIAVADNGFAEHIKELIDNRGIEHGGA